MSKFTPAMTRYLCGPVPHRGSALIIALVFLLVMTLIGVTAMQGTSQQERMAGNTRDRNLAFQAAEAALREGERWLDQSMANRATAVANVALATPAAWDGSNPTGTRDLIAAGAQLVANPMFYVNPPATVPEPSEMGTGSDQQCLRIYPVISRGTGGTDTAIVVLRSTYDPVFGGAIECPPI